ncbi:hypothetical protein ABOM_004937 [Aspergillus bombycis]|uniref:Uncharacterized protein n=1 Tax=Aspergillus bombycis TaxID=109264 RepID=A0A1F8A369_9EURO|nr:hypothetical protein ABOM_004937 [Aspergillus bombycis]OGM46151.1 hypothetical protein ABOM_004937 [Aspergillus bombycis]
MTDRDLMLYYFILLLAPTPVLGLREDNLFATDTNDLLRNVSAEHFEAGALPAISEAAVRPALSVVNMVSACGPVTHAALDSLAHRTRSAVLENATLKVANAVTTVAAVVPGATVERASGRSRYATGISPMKK